MPEPGRFESDLPAGAAAAPRTAPSTPDPVPEPMHVRIATGGRELIEHAGEDWRKLCDQGGSAFPFCRPEWAGAYMEAFAPDRRLTLLTACNSARTLAVLPLLRQPQRLGGIPVPALVAPMNTHCFRHDIPRATGRDGTAAIAALWDRVEAIPGWVILQFPYVVEGAAALDFAGVAQEHGYPSIVGTVCDSPYIPLAAGGENEWPCDIGRHLRHELRRWDKGLNSQGPVEVEILDHADRAALEEFFAIERSGWKGDAGTAIACRATPCGSMNP